MSQPEVSRLRLQQEGLTQARAEYRFGMLWLKNQLLPCQSIPINQQPSTFAKFPNVVSVNCLR